MYLYTDEDDYLHVSRSVCTLRAKWRSLCTVLGLRKDSIDSIEEDKKKVEDCLCEGLVQWLQGNYNTAEHGDPTWRKLVEAVADQAGGSNPSLAKEIALEHKNG